MPAPCTPSVPGYYWREWKDKEEMPDIAEIVLDTDGTLCVLYSLSPMVPLLSPLEEEMQDANFYGPIIFPAGV